MLTLKDFRVGQRVQLHPATDLWMRGARYGVVVSVGRKFIGVSLDKCLAVKQIEPRNIGEIL